MQSTFQEFGKSKGNFKNGNKLYIAKIINELINKLEINNAILVGHDIGGMVALAYSKEFENEKTVIMDVSMPGLYPWEEVKRNPYLWHFTFHNIPELLEKLVKKSKKYFEYFYSTLTLNEEYIEKSRVNRYIRSYKKYNNLNQGFNFYRKFKEDEENNKLKKEISAKVLYMQGEYDYGDIDKIKVGFISKWIVKLKSKSIEDSKHSPHEENAEKVAKEIIKFIQ